MNTRRFLVAVGSISRPTPYFDSADGEGISLFALDTETGRLNLLSTTGGIDNPTYVVPHPTRDLLFATSEVFGWNEGTVSAYRLDRASGKLDYINKQPSQGSLCAHLALDRTGRYVLATNYAHETVGERPGCATVIFRIGHEGGLLPAVSSVSHSGHGTDPVRQGVPHPHCALTDPANAVLTVADLGLDALLHYALDPATGKPAETPLGRTGVTAGSGPRHFAYSPNGKWLFLVNELSSAVMMFEYHAAPFHLHPIAEIPTLETSDRNGNLCAGIVVSGDGRHVYCSNRGDDSIACFAVDEAAGGLSRVGVFDCGGRTPRSIAISPDGGFMLVTNQNSNLLTVLRIDSETGGLSDAGSSFSVGTPACVKFL